AHGGRNGPCVMTTACTVIPTSKSVCEDNQGVWWGAGYTSDTVIPTTPEGAGYLTCAAVNEARYKAVPRQSRLTIVPELSVAVRNDRYKLVRNTTEEYIEGTDGQTEEITTYELFEID